MPDHKPKRILLVEDEAIIAMATKALLEEYGYQVEYVSRGEAAVAAVAADPGIDLVLIDIDLGPGMDGSEAAELILKNRDLPVVFLSSHTEPEIVEKTEIITSFGYVVKESGGTVLDASIKMAFKLFEAKVGLLEKEKVLRENEERYHAIFDNSLDAILLTAPDGRILEANAAAERMLSRPAEEIVRIGRPGILDASDPRLAPALAERTRTGRFVGELTFVRKDGTKFPAEVSTVVFNDREGRARTSMIIRDITERRLAEEALLQRNQYIESILDNMPIGFAVNTIDDGVFRYMNWRFEEIYGWPREVLKDVAAFFSHVYSSADRAEIEARIMGDIRSGNPARMVWDDVRITTQEGRSRRVSARNIPIPGQNLMVSTVWDMTAVHESQQALAEAEARYRLLFEYSPDGIVILDQETMAILMFNDTSHRQLGYSREEFAKLTIADIEAVEKPEELRARIARAIREGRERFETKQRTRDGRILDIQVRVRFTTLRGRPIYHCIWRDITGMKRRSGD